VELDCSALAGRRDEVRTDRGRQEGWSGADRAGRGQDGVGRTRWRGRRLLRGAAA